MNYYIGLDLGTSGIKGVVFDRLGNPIKEYLEEYDIISIKSGYAEESIDIWLSSTLKVLEKIGKLDIKDDIKGIGLSGQMHGLVLLDKDGNSLRNSIIWCDNRTDLEAKELEESIGIEDLKRITGNIAMPAFTLTKLLWVRKNEPEIYNKISKVMTPKDYIAYKLTNTFYQEYSDASGMQILDLNTLQISKTILDRLNIDEKIFGKLIKSDEIRGFLTKEIQEKTKLKEMFVCGGAGDQAAGAIGNGILDSNDLSIVLGSSGVVYSPTNTLVVSENGEVQTFLTAIFGRYHVMGVTNGCGTSLKWLRDNMFNMSYDEMTKLAMKIPAGGNNLYYLPYLLGERTPILDGDAKGIFFGLKNTTTKAEIIRCVMEGVGYSIKDCFNLLDGDKNRILISGGGAKSELYRKIIASMINSPVYQIKQEEGPSLGAAILAMVANKEYKSIEEACSNIIKFDKVTEPVGEWVEIYDKGYLIYKDIYNKTKDIFKLIKE